MRPRAEATTNSHSSSLFPVGATLATTGLGCNQRTVLLVDRSILGSPISNPNPAATCSAELTASMPVDYAPQENSRRKPATEHLIARYLGGSMLVCLITTEMSQRVSFRRS